MAALVWDQVGDRLYETGISKGVLYKEDRFGVPWNGLISVDESESNEVDPVYFDGVKFNDIVTLGDFGAVLRAFTFPDEFLPYEGVAEDRMGFYLHSQPKRRFHLSYQTRIGDDISGTNAGYKIHIFYNLTAIPSEQSYQTMSDSTEPVEFEWAISSIPEDIDGYRPTSYVVLDSRHTEPHLLADVESILYGDAEDEARLPPLKSLATFIKRWSRFIVTDHNDGTWTAEGRDQDNYITMLDETTFEITVDTAVYLDPETYELSSTDKNEEDIWLP